MADRKGKAGENRRRKAMGLKPVPLHPVMTARLPKMHKYHPFVRTASLFFQARFLLLSCKLQIMDVSEVYGGGQWTAT
jgi:hypothetical protein